MMEVEDKDLGVIAEKEGPTTYKQIPDVKVKLLSDGTEIPDVKTFKVFEEKETKGFCSPTKEYLNLIINNAKRYKFPQDYIKGLEAIKIKD